MRNLELRKEAFELLEEGYNNSQIARTINVPRRTVVDWFKFDKSYVPVYGRDFIRNHIDVSSFLKEDELRVKCYSYILGMYLGDGYISNTKGKFRIRITLDSKYPELNEYVRKSLNVIFPENKASIYKRRNQNCVDVSLWSRNLPAFFPQHGKGKKHNRKIELSTWQFDMLDWTQFWKGLFHSDGCFYTQHDKRDDYEYEHFVFSNMSEDISRLFQTCCTMHGIHFTSTITKSGLFKTCIYKQEEVKLLKHLIGTKEIVVE
jgi:hypothetical protein